MTTPIYKATIGAYIRQTEALAAIMAKGREHLGDKVDAFINESLCEDMLPFSFQIKSVHHASAGAITSLQTGHAGPPPATELNDYAALEAMVADTLEKLKAVSADDLDKLLGNDVGRYENPLHRHGLPDIVLAPEFLLPRHHSV
jgi:hypothetical protein